MLREFMLVFAFMLFMLSAYHVIQYAYGKETPRNGTIAILSLFGSMCYPIYYFSAGNSEYRADVFNSLVPIGAVVGNALNPVEDVLDRGINRVAGAGMNAAYVGAAGALIAPAIAPAIPAFAALLAGPLGVIILPLLAFLGSLINNRQRLFGGGKHLKKIA
uniref:Uncharacterized protein n=1 Tax=viral metagenome TaxID=1070528 RepID=A0A6C0CS40_9ZZZZ